MPYAHNGDVDVFYETFGEPSDPALLLVNGLGSQCINFRVEWCEKFAAESFFVLRFDNRDVGLSTHFSDVKPDLAAVRNALAEGRAPDVPYNMTDMANDAIAVLDAVGVQRAHVLGVSMGGMIVQTLAIEHPDRLLSMISIMSSTGDLDVGQSSPEALKLLMSPPPSNRDEYVARHLEGIRTWGSPAFYNEARLTENAGEAFDRCFDPAGQGRQMMAIISRGSRTEELRDVRTPALVIHGNADNLVNWSGGQRTAEAIPGARFELIDGMGHDYPPQLWDTLVDLVTGHARAT
jgi:pimeloyl-ACP methyl ester carboxylesterase